MPSSSRKRPSPRKGQTLISRFFSAVPRKSKGQEEQCGVKVVGHEGGKRVRAGVKRSWGEGDDGVESRGGDEENTLKGKEDTVVSLIDAEAQRRVDNGRSSEGGIVSNGDGDLEVAGRKRKRRRVVLDYDGEDDEDYMPLEGDSCTNEGAKPQGVKTDLPDGSKQEEKDPSNDGADSGDSKGDKIMELGQDRIEPRNRGRVKGLKEFERVDGIKSADIHRDPRLREKFERKLGRLEKNQWFMKRTGGMAQDPVPEKREQNVILFKETSSKVKYTPLEKQFVSIKKKHPDVVLMVECGYKFRFFGEDAEVASKVCRIWAHFDHNFNTASIPTHRLGYHLRRLVQAGHKVGVVRQMDTAALKKASSNASGPFSRKLTEVYSRGTMIPDAVGGVNLGGDESSGALSVTNFILSVFEGPSREELDLVQIAFAAVDVSTGEIVYDTFEDDILRANLETRLVALDPVELVLPTSDMSAQTERALMQYATSSEARVERISDSAWINFVSAPESGTAKKLLASVVRSVLRGKSLADDIVRCFSALSEYLKNFKLESALHGAKEFRKFTLSREMTFGADVMRNFELFANSNDGGRSGSLLSLVNRTKTAFGSRQLKSWLAHPLTDAGAINGRLEAVASLRYLVSHDQQKMKRQPNTEITDTYDLRLAELLAELPRLPDLERGLARIYYAKSSPSDFCSITDALGMVTKRVAHLKKTRTSPTSHSSLLLMEMISLVPDTLKVLESAIFDRLDIPAAEKDDFPNLFPPEKANLSEGSQDEGFDALVIALNKYKDQVLDCESSLNELLKELRVELNNPSLSWKRVGLEEYLVEVPGGLASRMPKTWLKVNQTSKVTRFRTLETAKRMELLEQARELRDMASKDAWRAFLRLFGRSCSQFQGLIRFLSNLDCLASLAQVANLPGYARPKILDPAASCAGIHAKGARHPVAETLNHTTPYVPNDVKIGIGADSERCMVITGPNMGGKSSYVRMCSLLIILSQIGSFVPAESVVISPFDAIYARMGATDAISKGLSTFMVELSETSAILARATSRSLVVLDELGRGTSTYDGMAVAQATIEHVMTKIRCRTFFVTHFPSVAHLNEKFPSILGSYYMDYLEESERDNNGVSCPALGGLGRAKRIAFLYKLRPGIARNSYGLNVALLADIPRSVVDVAEQKAREMETQMKARQNDSTLIRLVKGLGQDGHSLVDLLQSTA